MSLNNHAGYYGWLSRNNLGDDAIYWAAKKLFSNVELIDWRHVNNPDFILIGGGTSLPKAKIIKTDFSDLNKYAIGVGVNDPDFWNKPFSKYDIGVYFNNFDRTNWLNRQEINIFSNFMSKYGVLAKNHFVSEDDFSKLRDFNFNYIGVRGPLSQQILDDHSIESEITGDTALMLEPSVPVSEKRQIVINLREGSYQWSDDDAYVNTIVSFCKEYSHEYKFVFLPLYPPDISLHYKVAKSIDNAELRDYCSNSNVKGALNEIAQCKLVIGNKLHANVFAACTNTPFISLEYRPKNLDFAKSVGMERYNIRTDDLTKELLEYLVGRCLDEKEVIKDNMEQKVSYYRKLLESKSNDIMKDIN